MVHYTVENTGDVRLIYLSGELVIQHAAELKSTLMDLFADAQHIRVDVSSVTGADISCLQVLCAAHKMAMQFDKSFQFSNAWSKAFMQTARDACFLRRDGCFPDTEKQCLWVQEKING